MAFCKSAKLKVKSILHNFDQYVEDHIDTALKVTTSLKKLLSSPLSDVATALIPGDVDDYIKVKLRVVLRYAFDVLTIEKACKDKNTLDQKAACFIEQIKKVDPELQESILQKMASIITRELDNSRFAQNVYDLFVQAQYSLKK